MIGEAFGKQLIEPPDDWLPKLSYEYRQRSIELITVEEARTRQYPIFVKPPNNKSHKAELFQNGTQLTQYLEDDYFVLVSEPVSWINEYRCFVVDGKVVTASIYLRKGILQRQNDFISSPEELLEAISFAQSVLEAVSVPNPIVIDVGTIGTEHRLYKKTGWAVVEINAAWGSGIYGCDPKQVLRVLERY